MAVCGGGVVVAGGGAWIGLSSGGPAVVGTICIRTSLLISPSLKIRIYSFAVIDFNPRERWRNTDDCGDGNEKGASRLKKEHKKSFFELSHILFEVPDRAGELGVHSGRHLFPEVVPFHSAV